MDDRTQANEVPVEEPQKKERTVNDELLEMISPSTAVLSSYTHDEGEGFKALQ